MPVGEPAARHAALPADTAEDEDALTRAIIALASQYGRYGYRRITVCCSKRAGRWARIAWSASGVAKG